MALYDRTSRTCYIQFDYKKHRLWLSDTYNIQDDVMDELAGLGCQTIRIMEVKRPGFDDTEYEVKFSLWSSQDPTDYGFGSGIQYPLPVRFVRKTKVA